MFTDDEKYIIKMIIKQEIADVDALLNGEEKNNNELEEYLAKLNIIKLKLN